MAFFLWWFYSTHTHTHLFPLTVHAFISHLAVSSLIACVSALNSCFYEMMSSLSLSSYVSNFYLSCSNIFFCQVSLIFCLYFPVLFLKNYFIYSRRTSCSFWIIHLWMSLIFLDEQLVEGLCWVGTRATFSVGIYYWYTVLRDSSSLTLYFFNNCWQGRISLSPFLTDRLIPTNIVFMTPQLAPSTLPLTTRARVYIPTVCTLTPIAYKKVLLVLSLRLLHLTLENMLYSF